MFEIGEKIVYGSTGVCEVENIAPMDFAGKGEKELYYVLHPLYQDGVIYAPVQGTVYMRPILSAQEVDRLIDGIPQIEASVVEERSLTTLAAHYETILSTHDCRELLTLSMSLYEKKQRARQQKKKFGQIDTRFMKRTEELLFGEMAAALDIPVEKVPDYIAKRVGFPHPVPKASGSRRACSGRRRPGAAPPAPEGRRRQKSKKAASPMGRQPFFQGAAGTKRETPGSEKKDPTCGRPAPRRVLRRAWRFGGEGLGKRGHLSSSSAETRSTWARILSSISVTNRCPLSMR